MPVASGLLGRQDMASFSLLLLILTAGVLMDPVPKAQDTSLGFVLGGSWFARSQRGVAGTYLRSEFKEVKQKNMKA